MNYATFVNIKAYFSALRPNDLFFFEKGRKMYKVVWLEDGLIRYSELIDRKTYEVSVKLYADKKVYVHLRNDKVNTRFKKELERLRSGKKLR